MENKISLWVIGANDGVGKTTLSVAMTDIVELAGRSPRLVGVDHWRGLSRFIGDENVLSFESVLPLLKIRKNPNAILHQYDAVISEIEKGDSLLHFDAKATSHLLEYLKISRVDEDFSDMGAQVTVFIPAVADGHSLSGALALIDKASSIIPSARLVLVLNECRGQNFGADFEMARFSLCARGISIMAMPKIMSEGWDEFRRNRNRFKNIISMDLARLRELHGYSRPLARRAQNDIASWFEKMKAEVSSLRLVGLDALCTEEESECSRGPRAEISLLRRCRTASLRFRGSSSRRCILCPFEANTGFQSWSDHARRMPSRRACSR